jgi:type VI secretion system protein ImpB
MPESIQHKLDRVRPPRVQITYDVEIGGAIQAKELPLVVGVMADLSGNPEQPLPRLRDRQFIEIDRDNFNDVLAAAAPRLTLSVDNKFSKEAGKKTNIELKFKNTEDFNPLNVLQQVEVLQKLMMARGRLSDLISKLDGNDQLDALLQETAKDPDGLKQIAVAALTEGQNANA